MHRRDNIRFVSTSRLFTCIRLNVSVKGFFLLHCKVLYCTLYKKVCISVIMSVDGYFKRFFNNVHPLLSLSFKFISKRPDTSLTWHLPVPFSNVYAGVPRSLIIDVLIMNSIDRSKRNHVGGQPEPFLFKSPKVRKSASPQPSQPRCLFHFFRSLPEPMYKTPRARLELPPRDSLQIVYFPARIATMFDSLPGAPLESRSLKSKNLAVGDHIKKARYWGFI